MVLTNATLKFVKRNWAMISEGPEAMVSKQEQGSYTTEREVFVFVLHGAAQ